MYEIGQCTPPPPHNTNEKMESGPAQHFTVQVTVTLDMSSIYHHHIEHFFAFFAGNTVFSLISESPC